MILEKFYSSAIKSFEYLAVSLMVSAALITVLQVFFRYVLNSSISWVEEILGFLMVWLTFVGSALALHEKGHIGMNLIEAYIPYKFRIAFKIILDLFTTAFLLVFTWASIMLAMKLSSNYAVSFKVSMGIIYSVLPIAGAMMAITVLRDISLYIKSKKTTQEIL